MKDGAMNVLLTGATGGIDVLINNAGVNRFDLLDRQSEHDLEAVINTNLLAPMLLTQRLSP